MQWRTRYKGNRYWVLFFVHCTCLNLCRSKCSHVKCLLYTNPHVSARSVTIGYVGFAVLCHHTNWMGRNRKLPVFNRLSVPHRHNDQLGLLRQNGAERVNSGLRGRLTSRLSISIRNIKNIFSFGICYLKKSKFQR